MNPDSFQQNTPADGRRGLFLPLALAWLALLGVVFLLTWVRPWIGIPVGLAVVAGWYLLARGHRPGKIAPRALAIALLAALFWGFFGGVGGFLPQSGDYIKHNLMFHDLTAQSWPVKYAGEISGQNYLCYGLGYYLMPALGGKCFGEALVPECTFLWTLIGLGLFFYWVATFDGAPFKTLPIVLLFAATGVLWLGFKWHGIPGIIPSDGLVAKLKDSGLFFSFNDNFTRFQYQPQHALAGWVGAAVLYELLWREQSARGVLFVWAICVFWSPMSAVGLLVIPAAALGRVRWRSYFEPINLVAGVWLLAVFGIYLAGHVPLDESGPVWKFLPFGEWSIFYLILIALELTPVILLIWLDRKFSFAGELRPLLYLSLLALLLLPLYKLGHNSDLRLEASGPPLLFAALAASRSLVRGAVNGRRPLAVAFAVSYLIGASYPAFRPWLIFHLYQGDYSYAATVSHKGYHNLSEMRDLEFDSSRQYLGRAGSPAAQWLLR